MRFNRFFVLLMAAALIALGALFPMIVGKKQDASGDGEIFFATINDVQLEFAESDVTLMETISILCSNVDTVEIPKDLASMKLEKIEQIANAAAVQYQEAGIAFRSEDGINYGFEIVASQPVLAYSSSNDNQSSIFWYVNLLGHERSQYMNLIIDDRTGTVCSLEYSDDNGDYDKNTMKNIIYYFSGIYLDDLGEEFYDFNNNNILTSAKSPADNSYLASEISWWSDGYEYRTTFFVNTHEFYTYLSVVSY